MVKKSDSPKVKLQFVLEALAGEKTTAQIAKCIVSARRLLPVVQLVTPEREHEERRPASMRT